MKKLSSEPATERELLMDSAAHGVALPWSSQGRSAPFASGGAASLGTSVPRSRTEQGRLLCHFSSLSELSVILPLCLLSDTEVVSDIICVRFIHWNTCPRECLKSKFPEWRGTYEQHRSWSGLGTWGVGSQRFQSGWHVICASWKSSCAEGGTGQPQGDGVQQPGFPSSREAWGALRAKSALGIALVA